ncbi:MAG: biopolymer transport protein ExbB [Candidatus Azotimanducaceae bacterium]|jgi:biopolymer transport protein ExbB
MKNILALLVTLGLVFSVNVQAEDEIPAKTLGELLQLVRDGKVVNKQINEKRERDFVADKTSQQKSLNNAKAEQRREEARSERLEKNFEDNEQALASLQEVLAKRLGSLRELFGVLQQVAGDTRGVLEGSLVSAEYPGRGEWLGEFAASMGRSSKLASIEEIERLWFELQREMTESAKVTKFMTKINKVDGEVIEAEVIRIGNYNLISNGEYVTYDIANQIVKELPRQPAGRYVDSAAALTNATAGFTSFGLDPTRGQLLALQIQVPTLEERIQQGQETGYTIIALGIVALLLSVERFVTLTLVGSKVRRQIKADSPDPKNPLGRVLQTYYDNKDVDSETLMLKIDEAILKEQPAINARISFIKIISMVAPLLGLLGTVIGMILTFQAITLFGTGDPKTMAGGISSALMTTVLGLCVAIPTVLLHSIVSSRASSIMHILNEQSAGLIAEHAEKAGS